VLKRREGVQLGVQLGVRGKTKCNERECIRECTFNTLDGGFEGAKDLKTCKNRVKKQD
jgi:hypothetical protein